jgi:prephenate dehydrogenase
VDAPDVLEHARTAGAIHEGTESVDGLRGVELVVLATPIARIVDLCSEVAALGSEVIVTDAGSTKREIVRAAERAGVARFIGGHPVAGASFGGLEHARADLFRGRPWMLVPSATSDRAAEETVEALADALGAETIRMDATEHDRVMAYVSHVPQIVSSLLMARAGRALGDGGLRAAGRAFHEMTRLASSPAGIWGDILRTNADYIAAALDEIREMLPAGEADLRDSSGIAALFDEARAWRTRLVAASAGTS